MITIPVKTFKTAAARAKPFMGDEHWTPAIRGVAFSLEEGGLFALATDRYSGIELRAAEPSADLGDPGQDGWVSRETLDHLLKLIGRSEVGVVRLKRIGQNVQVTLDRSEASSPNVLTIEQSAPAGPIAGMMKGLRGSLDYAAEQEPASFDIGRWTSFDRFGRVARLDLRMKVVRGNASQTAAWLYADSDLDTNRAPLRTRAVATSTLLV